MVCNLGFENAQSFDEHINTRHPEFRCRVCNTSFGSAALLDAHYQESESHPKCPECQISFVDNVALTQHVISVFNPLIRDFGTLMWGNPQIGRHESPAGSTKTSFLRGSPGFRSPDKSASALGSPFHLAIEAPSPSAAVPSAETLIVGSPSDGFSPTSTQSSIASLSSPSVISLLQTPSPRKEKGKGKAIDLLDHLLAASPLSPGHASHHSVESQLPELHLSPHAQTSPAILHSERVHVPDHSFILQEDDALADDRIPIATGTSELASAVAVIASPLRIDGTPVALSVSTRSSVEDFVDVLQTHSPLAAANSSHSITRSPTTNETERRPTTPKHDDLRVASPVPSHVVFPSGSQPDRFRIVHSRTASRASSLMTDVSRQVVSQSHTYPARSPSPTAPAPTRLPPEPVTPVQPTESWRSAVATARAPAASELRADHSIDDRKLVSHIYCRQCRRDPCRQPTVTMCGHIFCRNCIISEVKQSSECPVCDAPTLLYSLIRLHVA
ncbi:hypothetical protein FA95DRAFT_936631 [Auriscalpium vulgare]|uniref:Uncharacterized protein n=1 Tax=Auriscalpium vulgare TaxID=40419 RepID=A0ACB8SAK1_9AGAM|nr:hypothetical protein FA95DRAFT_936631 [Auriscalpium vulgare]